MEHKVRRTDGMVWAEEEQDDDESTKKRYLFDIMDCERAIFVHISNESFQFFNFERLC